jgi:hypothetical protein
MFPTQFIPDFLVAEYYGLRNTIFWVAKDLAFGWGREGWEDDTVLHHKMQRDAFNEIS